MTMQSSRRARRCGALNSDRCGDTPARSEEQFPAQTTHGSSQLDSGAVLVGVLHTTSVCACVFCDGPLPGKRCLSPPPDEWQDLPLRTTSSCSSESDDAALSPPPKRLEVGRLKRMRHLDETSCLPCCVWRWLSTDTRARGACELMCMRLGVVGPSSPKQSLRPP